MAFCKYSIDMLANNTTAVDNIFINNYLPYAEPSFVKVYLYGLYKCQDSNAKDNTLENFANELNMKQEEVENAFYYWQEQGLVQLLNVIPFEVRYLPISDVLTNTKKYNAKKYETFNAQAQEILCGRMITPNEYREYYDIIERLHMEKEALLMIINYCVNIKGNNVGYAYITTIAKDWANQKITTAKQVEERLLEFETLRTGMEYIIKLLGIKDLQTLKREHFTKNGFKKVLMTKFSPLWQRKLNQKAKQISLIWILCWINIIHKNFSQSMRLSFMKKKNPKPLKLHATWQKIWDFITKILNQLLITISSIGST